MSHGEGPKGCDNNLQASF